MPEPISPDAGAGQTPVRLDEVDREVLAGGQRVADGFRHRELPRPLAATQALDRGGEQLGGDVQQAPLAHAATR